MNAIAQRSERLAHLAAALIAASCLTGVVAGFTLAAPAQASTDFYCSSCYLPEYGSIDIDPRQHNLTLSYAHSLSVSNAWICAGDWNTQVYVCNPGESYRSYSGQYYFASEISHYHGGLTTNAHADY